MCSTLTSRGVCNPALSDFNIYEELHQVIPDILFESNIAQNIFWRVRYSSDIWATLAGGLAALDGFPIPRKLATPTTPPYPPQKWSFLKLFIININIFSVNASLFLISDLTIRYYCKTSRLVYPTISPAEMIICEIIHHQHQYLRFPHRYKPSSLLRPFIADTSTLAT